jgi:hypothetical protein
VLSHNSFESKASPVHFTSTSFKLKENIERKREREREELKKTHNIL